MTRRNLAQHITPGPGQLTPSAGSSRHADVSPRLYRALYETRGALRAKNIPARVGFGAKRI